MLKQQTFHFSTQGSTNAQSGTLGSRPSSAKVHPLSAGKSIPRHGKQLGSDGVSYEDLLVAQYLEELRKSPQYNKIAGTNAQPSELQSPYSQRLAHTHIVPTPNLAKRRPQSAYTADARNGKPKVDSKFIADPDLWDPVTPREEKERSRRRPASAPVYKRSKHYRPLSAAYGGGSRPTSAKSGFRRSKPLYKRQPHIIVVTAYKNGDRENFVRVAAPNIKMLLEYCTEKLGLPNAARRLFLDDGTEVFTPKEIHRDSDVFVSMGETFKNPVRPIKKQTEMSKNATWTMNGLVWSQEGSGGGKKKGSKGILSKRFRSLIEQSRRRVLVFKNSNGAQGVEIVADPDRFEDFLVACTAKLDLGSYARVLYDWEGQEISKLDDAPVLDQCLQTWSTPVLGPLWVSKGEGFSPKGVSEFLQGLITYTKAKLKEAKNYREQLQCAQDEESRDKVDIVAILSMSESEISETLDIVAKDIEDFSNALDHLKEQNEKIKSMLGDEEEEGYEYTLKHIEKFDSNHRMVGTKGIRLRVYENGTCEGQTAIYFNLAMGLRGIGNDKNMLMARLLDQCSSSTFLANPKHNPAIRPMARKLFNKFGKEIKSIMELENDAEVWLSFGEPWKNPFTYVLTSQFDRLRVFENSSGVRRVTTETLMTDDVQNRDKAGKWEVVIGVPEDTESQQDLGQLDNEMTHILQNHENATLARCKDDANLLVYPSIVVDAKKVKGSGDVWPPEAQIWVISKNGYIFSKAMPQLVLTATEERLTTSLGHPTQGQSDTRVDGYVVSLQRKASGLGAQQWGFTADGYIYASSQPEVVLTYLGSQFGNEESQVQNESEEHGSGAGGPGYYLALCEKLDSKDAKAQRWALKQERMDNLGQWKHTRAENPEWNKKALSWPVKEDGEINDDYDWPMEGFLLPYAPPLKQRPDKRGSVAAAVPLRLMVLKNGVRDIAKATAVVGPDLTNMKKDFHKTKKGKKTSKSASSGKDSEDTESIDVDEMLHCDEDLTVLKLEFILFLERCTSMLDLPFAARRVFDETGKEHFSLRSLTRDQLVYASCGDPWSDPNLSKAEQQRRYLLANLSSDVAQMRQYVALREPNIVMRTQSQPSGTLHPPVTVATRSRKSSARRARTRTREWLNLVLTVEAGVFAGAHLVVNECALVPEIESSDQSDNRPPPPLPEEPVADQADQMMDAQFVFMSKKLGRPLTSHEIAHIRSEARLNKLKWPWERICNDDIDHQGASNGDEEQFTNQELYQKFNKSKPRRRPDHAAAYLQKFVLDEGYIVCASNHDLVLGVSDQESRIVEVVLVKRRPDDIHQRWIVHDNGLIQAKNNPQMVLTVSMPTSGRHVDEDGLAMSYMACSVSLQQKRTAQFGRANQRWYYDQATGFIQAFYTDSMDKEVTAANKANVCTYAVMGDMALDQPGYMVEMQQGEKGAKTTKKLLVCSACARAMRGRHKLERVQGSVDFACSMGQAKELGVRQVGSFQCLNGKVDLSTHEAEHTLDEWEDQLERLKDELSVRAIAKEISAARAPYTVKVLAYKNGEGRMKPGEVVVGSSAAGILEQCTERLGLNQAARRMYTADGTLTLDLDDLVDWVREEHVREARRHLRAEARAKKLAAKGQGTDADKQKLIDKVQLDSDSGSSDEAEEDEAATQQDDAGSEFSVGYFSTDRQKLDPWRNFVILPNPAEQIECDGYVIAWKLYAKRAGVVSLQVYRPTKNDLTAFVLTGQVTFSAERTGEHTIDISDTPMEVKRGDMIGFHVLGEPVIPYDVDEETNQSPYYLLPKERPDVGDTLKMESWMQAGMRKYSLSALVVPASKVQSRPTTNGAERPAMQGAAKNKNNKKKKNGGSSSSKGPHIEPPPVDMVLRYPIEVWVSGGETFVKPSKVEQNYEHEQQLREERAAVAYELEKEKHVLRQMQGRRYDDQAPGNYRSTRNPSHPVLVEGHWQDPSINELQKHDTVHQLQTHLSEMKTAQKPKGAKTYNVSTTRRLYTQPAMTRLLVFPSGESMERAVYVWGDKLAQVLDNATTRLTLRKPAKHMFTLLGKMVEDLDEVERDQMVCVSATRTFVRPKESQQAVEVKANWGRARRQYGPYATDIVVQSNKNPGVDVDPFGPSALSGGPGSKSRSRSQDPGE